MAEIIETHRLISIEEAAKTYGPDLQQIYNGLDCCVTLEVWNSLQAYYNEPPITYNFERALQAPALEMMLRGFRIDLVERERSVRELREKQTQYQAILDKLAIAVWDKPLNPRSPKQLLEFFYKHLNIPEIWSSKKGVKSLSMDRETLEKLDLYLYARPFVACILSIRELAKKLDVLEAKIDPDGRMRTSINVGATETGRFSASKSTTGSGTNFFNITSDCRRIFVADPGYKLCAIDLEQAESREVGRLCGELFNEWAYLDACEAGDLHTAVARLIWPELAWTGDGKKDRQIAEEPFYRHYSYRDIAKRGGHGTNYLGSPFQMARHLKVPTSLVNSFQERYFDAFPGIQKWHRWTAEQIQSAKPITTVFGRTRHFFGRPNDDQTVKEAVAYNPQSSTADRLNIGLYRIWHDMSPRIEILLQLYDAIYFQYREDDDEEEIVAEALRLVDVPIKLANGRMFSVPGEAKVGWNWTPIGPNNPDGLAKFKGKDTRQRVALLDRIF